MRSILVTHLWKEWRDQRTVLASIAVAIPVLVLGTFVGLGNHLPQAPGWTPVFLGGAAMLVALALATDAFAGESARGTLRFLRRQPGALHAAAAAKVTAYVLGVVSATLWSAACVWTAARITGGQRLADAVAATLSDDSLPWAVPFAVLAGGAWTLLVSTWIPRGAAAVAGAGLLLGAIALPGALAWADHERFLEARIASSWLLRVSLVALPLALAGGSIARGHRFVARSAPVAAVGLGAVAVVSVAGYAFAAQAFDAWRRVDPRTREARLEWTYVARGGRHAYVNVVRSDDPALVRPIRVDLRTGEYEEFAPPGHVVSVPWGLAQTFESVPPGGHDVLVAAPRDVLRSWSPGTIRYFDAESGEDIGRTDSRSRFPSDDRIRSRIEAAERRATFTRTADGRRAWRTAEGFAREEANGRVTEVRFPDGVLVASPYAWGWNVMTASASASVDASDPGPVASPRTWPHPKGVVAVSSLSPTEYLVRSGPKESTRNWSVFDARTGALSPAPGLEDGDEAYLLVDSRRALTSSRRRGEVSFARVDLRDGAREPVSIASGPTPTQAFSRAGRTPGGRLVLQGLARRPEGGEWHAHLLYDPEANRIAGCVPSAGRYILFLGAVDEDHALFHVDGRSIERVRWSDGSRERLFPR